MSTVITIPCKGQTCYPSNRWFLKRSFPFNSMIPSNKQEWFCDFPVSQAPALWSVNLITETKKKNIITVLSSSQLHQQGKWVFLWQITYLLWKFYPLPLSLQLPATLTIATNNPSPTSSIQESHENWYYFDLLAASECNACDTKG